MNKRFIYSLAATFITAAVTLGSLTACSSEDIMVVEKQTATQAQTYTVSIPATMGDDAETRAVTFNGTNKAVSTFAEGDKVYIYNETKGAMACDGEGNAIALTLTPGDISNDGKNCTLAGTLTFYKYENSTWNAVAVESSDSYKLLYNLSQLNTQDPTNSNFWYIEQDGTAAGIADYAIATTTLTEDGGQLTPSATVSFTNVQSMFRFQFIDESSNAINVKHLVITSKNYAVASFYTPLLPSTNPYIYDTFLSFPVTLATPTTDYIYVALCIKESEAAGDELSFKAVDADGKVYTGTKAAPTDGFKNGKYYYNSSAITLTHDASKDITAPNIVWTNPNASIEPNYEGKYNIYSENFDITLSGTSRNCDFYLINAGTVRLNGINATYSGPFFNCGANLTVELLNGSANTIVNTNNTYGTNCIGANTLKLSGNGTLTVTAKSADYCGIRGTTNYSKDKSNNDKATTTAIDVSAQLAADGYKVTRSARSDNSDGTFTWTYTVRPLIDLSSLTGDYVAQDGDMLTGTLASNLKLKIAAGATVTLAGMTHHAGDYINSIECLGTANIILAEGTTNDLTRGSSDAFAGLFLNNGITWSILTISGTGTLLASGGFACAGIGGINYCNDIVINGGIIYATGGQFAPGIGAGANVGQTGNITINGGNITATGGEGAAGIGAGCNSSYCKDITIENTVTSVKAIKGAGASESIGRGSGGNSCGTVKFGTATMFDDSRWTTTPNSGNNYGLLHFVISTTTNPNDTWTLTPLNQGQGGLQDYNVNPANEQ